MKTMYFDIMSIKIRFEKGPLIVQTTLRDGALAPLMALVQEHGADETESTPATEGLLVNFSQGAPETVPQTSIDPERHAKEWLAKHSAAEVLNKLAWNAYPEKILALGAFHESKAGEDFESWRSADIVNRFGEAKDNEPANFPRDIATAIKSGWIATKTPRTYIVSRTGWIRLSTAISKLPPA